MEDRMNNPPRLVDVSSLAPELDRLSDLPGSDSEHFDGLLTLVERLRDVAAQGRVAPNSDEGWAAVAFGDGADLDLYCSRLNAVNVVVRSTWAAGELVSAWNAAGERMWLIQQGPGGELLKSVHSGPTAVEADLIAPGLPAEVEALTSGMLDELKGRVDEETRALIEAAMAAPPGAKPNGKNSPT
jgi:hypothetical protein